MTHPAELAQIHTFDQLFAGADDYLDRFIAKYREAEDELGETQNLSLLAASAVDLGEDLAPLFAAAVRRLSRMTP